MLKVLNAESSFDSESVTGMSRVIQRDCKHPRHYLEENSSASAAVESAQSVGCQAHWRILHNKQEKAWAHDSSCAIGPWELPAVYVLLSLRWVGHCMSQNVLSTDAHAGINSRWQFIPLCPYADQEGQTFSSCCLKSQIQRTLPLQCPVSWPLSLLGTPRRLPEHPPFQAHRCRRKY